MKCDKCGAELESNALVCPSCGQAVSEEQRMREQYGDRKLTKKEFLKLPAMKPCVTNIKTCGIAFYVIGVINIVLYLFWGEFPIDGIILILLGLGIHLGVSRVCAVLSAAYGAFNLIYVVMTSGTIGGWWVLLAAVYAVIYVFKFHKAWGRYQKDGTFPVAEEKKK